MKPTASNPPRLATSAGWTHAKRFAFRVGVKFVLVGQWASRTVLRASGGRPVSDDHQQ